jgi:hypothetical protein
MYLLLYHVEDMAVFIEIYTINSQLKHNFINVMQACLCDIYGIDLRVIVLCKTITILGHVYELQY